MSVKGPGSATKGSNRTNPDLRRADPSSAPADRPENIRNVVLIGRSGAGKTMLLESLLYAAGVVNRMGSIVDGTTVSDSEATAIHQQRSIGLSAAPLSSTTSK
ncbi:elongation factor G-like protein [Arthrobacter sp. Hiyo1]|nr:elongation factor G-like protein [Arthrobacter sp. Hiyo1]